MKANGLVVLDALAGRSYLEQTVAPRVPRGWNMMPKLKILIAPDPVLKKHSERVERVDAATRRLMDDMLETMHAANGIGLAAPQVGVLKRIIVVDVARPPEQAPQPYRMANPEIVWRSEAVVAREEGCLSLPDYFGEVMRAERVRVRFLDHENEIREIEAAGLLGRCIQHEIDHLEGTLFVDHLSALKRNIILRKLSKTKKQHVATAAAV
jgi:peptide deformylase